MTLADTVNKIAADVDAIKNAQAAAVDLTPVTDAVAAVKSDTTAILADLTATPPV